MKKYAQETSPIYFNFRRCGGRIFSPPFGSEGWFLVGVQLADI
jgi:hypothetical protein